MKSIIKYKCGLIVLIAALFVFSGCVKNIFPVSAEERDTLSQVSTLDTLLAGNYDGVIEIGSLRQYGDFGIGTLDRLNGELIMLDGVFYNVQADGIAYTVSEATTTPFASVTFFDIDRREALEDGLTFAAFEAWLYETLPTENLFYAVKLQGTFSYLKTRSVPAQEKPYPPLAEVTKNQPTFEFTDVTGTMVGFRCPPYVTGINVPGYHLHFITDDRTTGGHLLEFTVTQADVYVDYMSRFLLLLPAEDSGFYQEDLSVDRQDEMEQVEK